MKPILLAILIVSLILTVHLLRENDREITARLAVVEARQSQIILMAQHNWEPMDLTYLPRITRNPELIQKEGR